MGFETAAEFNVQNQREVQKAAETLSRWFDVKALRIGSDGLVYFDSRIDSLVRQRIKVINVSQEEVAIVKAALDKIKTAAQSQALDGVPSNYQARALEAGNYLQLIVKPNQQNESVWQCQLEGVESDAPAE